MIGQILVASSPLTLTIVTFKEVTWKSYISNPIHFECPGAGCVESKTEEAVVQCSIYFQQRPKSRRYSFKLHSKNTMVTIIIFQALKWINLKVHQTEYEQPSFLLVTFVIFTPKALELEKVRTDIKSQKTHVFLSC